MPALYRKYRPQLFKDLIGQNHIKITLEHEIERGEIGHAYLFCGPRGLGKTTAARLFAKAVNCENRQPGQSEPCNKCRSCLSVISGSAVDVMEIDAASHTGVDNVRENIIENARFTPVMSRYKVFIIDEVHMLSLSAFNALLKTLEEPPGHAIFVLCTTELHKLPETIVSRCQHFNFHKVSGQEMVALLSDLVRQEGKRVDEAVLKTIVLNSDGCIRDAESLLGQVLTLGDDIDAAKAELILPRSDYNQVAEFLEYLLEKNATAAVELLNRLVGEGVDLEIFVANLLEFLRKVMLIKVGGKLADFGLELSEDMAIGARRMAERFDYPRLVATIEIFLRRQEELRGAAIRQFPLEIAAIEICEEIVCEKENAGHNEWPKFGAVSVSNTAVSANIAAAAVKNEIAAPAIAAAAVATAKIAETKAETPAPAVESEPAVKTEPVVKPKPVAEIIAGNLKLEDVTAAWPQIVENLLTENYTLASMLKISRPLNCRENILEIGVKNNFFKDRLETYNNKSAIEKAIGGAIGAPVAVKGIVDENIEPLMEAAPAAETAPETIAATAMPAADHAASPATAAKAEVIKPFKAEKPADAIQDAIGLF